MKTAIPRLVVVLDRAGCRLPWTSVARLALDSGADQVQIREPSQPTEIVASMVKELIESGIDPARLTVNGHPRAALVHGTNAHLPSSMNNMNPELTAGRLLSRSVHGEFEDNLIADYVVLGNVCPTDTHPGKPGLGEVRVRAIVNKSTLPVLAIGGMTPETMGPFVRAGAYGVAVRSYVIGSDDPADATNRLRNELERWI